MRLRLGPMKITFCCTDTKAEPWLQGLAAALPGADISVWQPGAPQADCAVVWAPPQQFMDEQPGLKALFNIGAGVDALLKLRLPPKALVVRLDDAGMAVQMAEYVCHAVIRYFREFADYDTAQQETRWAYRKPRRRQQFSVGVLGLGVLAAASVARISMMSPRISRAPASTDSTPFACSRSTRMAARSSGSAGRKRPACTCATRWRGPSANPA